MFDMIIWGWNIKKCKCFWCTNHVIYYDTKKTSPNLILCMSELEKVKIKEIITMSKQTRSVRVNKQNLNKCEYFEKMWEMF